MIGPEERAFLNRSFGAFADAVRFVEVVFRRVLGHAEGAAAAGAMGIGETWAGEHACPLRPRSMLGFFVAAPGLGDQRSEAECTLPRLLCAGWRVSIVRGKPGTFRGTSLCDLDRLVSAVVLLLSASRGNLSIGVSCRIRTWCRHRTPCTLRWRHWKGGISSRIF